MRGPPSREQWGSAASQQYGSDRWRAPTGHTQSAPPPQQWGQAPAHPGWHGAAYPQASHHGGPPTGYAAGHSDWGHAPRGGYPSGGRGGYHTAPHEQQEREIRFWCESCEKGFFTRKWYDIHCSEHLYCDYEGCKFVTNKEDRLETHKLLLHLMYPKLNLLDTEKYISDRRARFPTRALIDKKNAKLADRRERGDVMPGEMKRARQHNERERAETAHARGGTGRGRGRGRGAAPAGAAPAAPAGAAPDAEPAPESEAFEERSSAVPVVIRTAASAHTMVKRKTEDPLLRPPKRRRLTLLDKLLRRELLTESRMLLQSLRFFIKSEWLTAPVAWEREPLTTNQGMLNEFALDKKLDSSDSEEDASDGSGTDVEEEPED